MKRKLYLKNQTIYQIYVRNHTKEGTFTALISDLPRLKALGVDILYLLPIHPIGEIARKGTLGSPYAIKDYYKVNPELGTLEDFQSFLHAAHSFGFKVMIDIVLHHTSPDAVLLKEHPEFYFYKNGKLGNKIGDWSDIIDLDYNNKDLWVYMKDMLVYWANIGVDGYRADVAPLVPIAFWEYIREELDKVDQDLIWLSESVEPHFLTLLNANNHVGHSDLEMYCAFDILYDYDVYPSFKAYLEGNGTLNAYLDLVRYQEANYPLGYLKIRTIENHDTSRINDLCKNELVLRNVTAWSFFQNGVGFLYAGQEMKAKHRPTLFDVEKVDLEIKDEEFYTFIKQLVDMKKYPIFKDVHTFSILNNAHEDVIVARLISDEERLYGIFNLCGKEVEVNVLIEEGVYENIITGNTFAIKKGSLVIDEPLIFFI
ncbi:MAG: alpha-amylase family glycosyl hydrolase [Bacilli bacterium]|nr:alpha-amylase family glycosyl hydrolase [Bacilli bacterium]